MIIAVDTNCIIPGKVGGIEAYTTVLVESLLEADDVNRLVLITRPENHAMYGRYEGPRCEAVLVPRPSFEGDAVSNWPELLQAHPAQGAKLLTQYQVEKARRIGAMGADVIHFPGNAINPLNIAVPAVLNIHDLQHRHYPEYFSNQEIAHRDHWWGLSARRAQAVVASSQFVANDLHQYFGVPREKLFVIPPPLSAHFLEVPSKPELEALRAKLGLGMPFFLYPAHAWPHKNHERLIQAFVQANLAETELVLTGGGQEIGTMPELARKHRSAGVRLMGQISQKELLGLYHLALALILPSQHEASSFPIMEAMACGCPVASSNVTSLPELIGEAGLLFDPLDMGSMATVMRRLRTQEELRGQLAALGKIRAQQFSGRDYICTLKKAYGYAITAYELTGGG